MTGGPTHFVFYTSRQFCVLFVLNETGRCRIDFDVLPDGARNSKEFPFEPEGYLSPTVGQKSCGTGLRIKFEECSGRLLIAINPASEENHRIGGFVTVQWKTRTESHVCIHEKVAGNRFRAVEYRNPPQCERPAVPVSNINPRMICIRKGMNCFDSRGALAQCEIGLTLLMVNLPEQDTDRRPGCKCSDPAAQGPQPLPYATLLFSSAKSVPAQDGNENNREDCKKRYQPKPFIPKFSHGAPHSSRVDLELRRFLAQGGLAC